MPEQFLVEIDVMTGCHLVIKGFGALRHDSADLSGSCMGRQMVEGRGLLYRPKQAPGTVGLEKKSISGVLLRVQMSDGVAETSHLMGIRQGAVDGTNHLRKAAGLESGRHHHEVGCPVAQMFQGWIVVIDGDPFYKTVNPGNIPEDLLIGAIG